MFESKRVKVQFIVDADTKRQAANLVTKALGKEVSKKMKYQFSMESWVSPCK
jgi:hypothetical protein